jgi:hypothetical protein
MAITAEQAAQLASTYQAGDTSGLQGLVSSMGVTAGDVAQYFPGFDVGSLQGVTLAPSAPAAPAPTYGTGKFTGDVISNYIASNLQNPELIAQKAKEFGISAADIQKAAGYTPEQQARFFSYAGVTPTGITGLTPLSYGDKNQFTAKEVMDYVNRYVDDPTRLFQASQRYAVTPEQLQTLYAGSATPYELGDIKKYFETGQKGLSTRLQDIIASTIGTPDVLKTLEGVLPSSVSRLTSMTPESVSKKSIEEIEKLIAESPTNRLQEAGRVRGLAETIYGLSSDKAKQMASDLYAGRDTDDFAEKLYGDLLKGGYSKDLQNKILQDAAVRSPESKYFKENPEELLKYSPLTEKTGQTGVYGYLNDAPILNANFADKKLGDKNQVVPHLGSDPNNFGWTTNSKYTETIMRGPAIFGLEFNNRNDIEKAIAIEQGLKNGTIVQDYEFGGYYNTRTGERSELPKSDNERRGYAPESLTTLTKLQEAAQKAGINPVNYRSAGDLFDALENKTKNIYQVVGRAIDWDPTAAKNLGITQTSGGRGGVNQANVLYEKIGDKLVPITAKAFEFHDPNTSRGFFGDFFSGIASIPFVAELALLNPATAAYYPVIKGAQTVALGGDIGDAIKAGGLAYLTTQFIPKNITPSISTALAQTPLLSDLALMPGGDKIANFIIDGGTRAIISSGLAAITGQDPDKAALNALVSSGIGTMTNEGLKLTNIPEQYRGIVSNIISSTVLGQDPKKSLAGAATGILKNELKDFGKEVVKSDQDKTTGKEIKI